MHAWQLTKILLTENLKPKLSDFGLEKMVGMEESKVFTDVRGTMGYMDPEYMSNAKLTCALVLLLFNFYRGKKSSSWILMLETRSSERYILVCLKVNTMREISRV